MSIPDAYSDARRRSRGARRRRGAKLAAAIVLAGGIGLSPALALAAAPGPVATPAAFEPAAANPAAPVADTEIKTRLDQGNSLTIAGERLHLSLLRRFYAGHGYLPVWDSRPEVAKALWAAVLRAGDQGLDPNLFHAAALINPGVLSPIDRDLLLSDAFLGYADALARGALPVEARNSNEELSPDPVDVVGVLDSAITSPKPSAVIDALAPNTPEYAAMRRGYQTYQAIAKAGGWPRVDAASPGERLRQLQQRLSAEGYLPAGFATGVNDDQTIAALRAFQEHHGIEPDGRLGPATLAELNVSADARAQQIAVGLERMRWLTRDMPATRIWVNTAIQRLQFFQNGQVAFTTRVVIGQLDKQTPEFATTINSLLYNPPWNVPYSITTKEILPKLEEDPDYLERHNMVMRDNGSVTQLPGAGTALGRIKFEMEDKFDVYLHDTPQRYLFARENRRLSHGCVRVQNPRDLASLISDIPIEDINRGIARGTTTRHMVPAPIPVYIVYQTAYVGDDGQIAFAHDYYRRDDAVWRHLVPTAQLPVAGQDYGSQRHG